MCFLSGVVLFRHMSQNVCILYIFDICGTHPSNSPWFEYLESVCVVMLRKGKAHPVHFLETYRCSVGIAVSFSCTPDGGEIIMCVKNIFQIQWQKVESV
jgi:hypothetical protein